MKETISDKIIRLLEVTSAGMSAEEIMAALTISKQSLYSAVHAFNQKKTGQKIKSLEGKYRLIGGRKNLPALVDSDTSKNIPTSGLALPSGFAKKAKNLSLKMW
jgi:hypothetical protein